MEKYKVESFFLYIYSNSNTYYNSIFIAPNLHLKTDSRRDKQKEKTIIINLGHSKGQCHGEKPGKANVRVDMLVRRDRF